jgi:biotin carboxylase
VDPEKTLLLVGHPTAAVRAAKGFGLDVVLVQHKSKLDAEQAELADVTLVVDYTDWSAVRPLVEAVHARWGFSAALSLTDPGMDAAGRVNDLFGLGGTGHDVCRRFRDKLETRRRLTAAGAPAVGAELLDDRTGLVRFGDRYGYPFIVKPRDLAGGFGVLRVDGPADAGRVWERVSRVRATGVDRGPSALFTVADFVMEEYVDGPEFSVEAFSFAGRHVVVAVTEKLTDEAHFAELGHALPARLDPATEDAVVAAVTGCLDAVGLADGPSHTEVRVGSRGPVVIESHNRIGGDRIGDLVEAAYGIDLTSWAVGWPFRLVDEPPARPGAAGGACVRFLHAPAAGRVAGVDGLDEARAVADVLDADVTVRAGDPVRAVENNWDRLGLVVTRGVDTDAAVKLCDGLVEDTLRVRVEPAR